MAAYKKFNSWAQALSKKVVVVDGNPPTDTYKVMLTDVAPVATNVMKTDLTEIAAGNGYTAGGTAHTTPKGTFADGVETFATDQVVFTASGGSIAQFRYAVLYNSTTGYLVAWGDYGDDHPTAPEVNLGSGSSFTVRFNAASLGGTIFTLQ